MDSVWLLFCVAAGLRPDGEPDFHPILERGAGGWILRLDCEDVVFLFRGGTCLQNNVVGSLIILQAFQPLTLQLNDGIRMGRIRGLWGSEGQVC